MSKPNKRRVRLDEFRSQIREKVIAPDARIEVEVSDGQSVWITLPIGQDPEGPWFAAYEEALKSSSAEDLCRVILAGPDGEVDGEEAERQLAVWRDAGGTVIELLQVFGAERAAAEDRMRAFRYSG